MRVESTGETALASLQKENSDLVILDYMLPEMDGLAVLKEIKRDYPFLPTIMMTAYSSVRLGVESMKAGACYFIEKPLDRELLNIQIQKAFLQSQEALETQRTKERLEVEYLERVERITAQVYRAQKMEAIGQLAGGIAHDFNNILTPIIGQSKFVLEDLPSESPIREEMEEILKYAYKAKALVRQILDFSREKAVERCPLEIASIITDVVKLLRRALQDTVTITTEIHAPGTIIGKFTDTH